ncbi:MAG: MBL fold metallo-hydrolase [Planctomycetota bacterium]
MKVISLQSGSNGNCFYVETGDVRLLFDAGISGKKAKQRLAEHGRNIEDVDALFISHDHSDHVSSMGVYQRKFGMPIYITRQTLQQCYRSAKVGPIERVRFFRGGETILFDNTQVHTVPTAHDSVDGCAFVVEDSHSGQRVGILTDLGHVFDGLRDVLKSLDAVVIESNYDEGMLRFGPYPEHLKRRIRGRGGHLSNDDAARLLAEHRSDRLKWACLCHLSEENNEPDIARKTHEEILGHDVKIHVASRYTASGIFEL